MGRAPAEADMSDAHPSERAVPARGKRLMSRAQTPPLALTPRSGAQQSLPGREQRLCSHLDEWPSA